MSYRNTLALALAAACYILIAPVFVAAQADDAREAAEDWLALIDAEDYAASWEAAARSFQSAVTAETWAAQLAAGRAQVGGVEERELAHTQPLTDPPGAPPGRVRPAPVRQHLRWRGPGHGERGARPRW
jgi:ATP/maltotriose-dependent transcriptional regulator MalT